jgi:hypothetical protein
MDSLKTKSDNYSLVAGKAIGGVVLVPEGGHFNMYVAWEWEDQAENKFFAIVECPHLIGNDTLNSETINNVANYGTDVTHKKEVQKLFPQLF